MAHTFGQLQLYLASGVVAPAVEALQGELRGAKTLEAVIFEIREPCESMQIHSVEVPAPEALQSELRGAKTLEEVSDENLRVYTSIDLLSRRTSMPFSCCRRIPASLEYLLISCRLPGTTLSAAVSSLTQGVAGCWQAAAAHEKCIARLLRGHLLAGRSAALRHLTAARKHAADFATLLLQKLPQAAAPPQTGEQPTCNWLPFACSNCCMRQICVGSNAG